MRFTMPAAVITGVAAASLAAMCSPALAVAASGPSGWQAENLSGVLSSQTPSTLNAGTAVSKNDVWAVGYTQPALISSTFNPLILNWNGTAWTKKRTAGIPGVELTGVAASAHQVWVSGLSADSPSPTPGPSPAPLPSPSSPPSPAPQPAFSAGYVYRSSGNAWVSVPLPAGMDEPKVISGPGGQVWAIGSPANEVARWTGKTWQVYNTGAKADPDSSGINALGFHGSKDGWAVGYSDALPVVLHWNGTAWHTVKAPATPSGGNDSQLQSVLVTSAGVWATGLYDQSGQPEASWLVHWTGSSWATIAIPSVTETYDFSIESISGNQSGQPEWISCEAGSADPPWLQDSGGSWTPNYGPASPSDTVWFLNSELVSVPGTSETLAIGTAATVGSPLVSRTPFSIGRIYYAP